jgi:hypothetical protein
VKTANVVCFSSSQAAGGVDAKNKNKKLTYFGTDEVVETWVLDISCVASGGMCSKGECLLQYEHRP